ncbi:MAG: hypothetical protein HQ509_02660 [Candidatus Marinimicrobia bacterium]|nr:hypothetical protein [Candidatus Neomarinimicrobiota bacterium]
MKPQKLLELFEDLADRLEIRIVHGKGDFQGGPCLVNGENVIVVNKQKLIEQRLKILAEGFGNLDLSDVYIKPALRSYIDEILHTLFSEKS